MLNLSSCVRLSALVLAFASIEGAQGIVEGYAPELHQLDSTNPQSVCQARDSLRTLLPKASLNDRAAMFRSFRTFYLDAVGSTSPEFCKEMQPYSNDILGWLMKSEGPDPLSALLKSRPDIHNAGADWFDCGFAVMEGEGDIYPDQNSATLLEFAGQLPRDLQSYVRFRAKEDAQRVLGDAAIMMGWDQLRQRLGRWEAFARSHPRLLETRSEVQPEIKLLANLYLFGSENSQTFHWGTGQVEPELLASWKLFASNDRASRYHALLTSLMARLGVNNLSLTEQDRPLFEQVGFEKEFDSWWRNSRREMTDSKRNSLEY